MNKFCLIIIFVLSSVQFAIATTFNERVADDKSLSAKSKDLWVLDDTIDGHMQANIESATKYLDLIDQFANLVIAYQSKGEYFKSQRSLVADSLALIASRNFLVDPSGQSIDVQLLLEREFRNGQSKAANPDFLKKVVFALSYSNLSTSSFFNRFFAWSQRLDERDQSIALRNLKNSNDVPAAAIEKFKLPYPTVYQCHSIFVIL